MRHFEIDGNVYSMESEKKLIEYLVEKDKNANNEFEFVRNFQERDYFNNHSIVDAVSDLIELGDIKELTPVYVYGSLRKGLHNHHLLENAVFYGQREVTNFEMFSLGAYPFCKPTEDENEKILCELYYVNKIELARLDRLEGFPSFYDRKVVNDMKGSEGWIYFIENRVGKIKVNGGNWSEFSSTNQNNIYNLF